MDVLNKNEAALFQAIDTTYNDPEIAANQEIRARLLAAAKDLQHGTPYQMVAIRLRQTISRYVLLNHLQAPAALNRLYMAIGSMGDRYQGEAVFFTQLFR